MHALKIPQDDQPMHPHVEDLTLGSGTPRFKRLRQPNGRVVPRRRDATKDVSRAFKNEYGPRLVEKIEAKTAE